MSLSMFEYLRHILDEINYLEENTRNLDFQSFIGDETKTRAFIRSLEIIGEAVKKLSSEFKDKYKGIEWKNMSGMRDKLIHDYFWIDYELVWDVVENKIPLLKGQIEKIFEENKNE